MNKYLIGILSLCFLPVTANATPKISLPAFMKAMRPPQAKTRFFGEVKFPTPVHNVYYLHFYEFPQTPPVVIGPDERQMDADKDYVADLFTRQIRKRKVTYKLVNRLKLDSSYFNHEVFKFDLVRPEFMWLIPAKRQIPILRINCMVTDGFYGAFSEDILFTFDKGFVAKPVMQGFYNYGNHIDSKNFGFDKIDERGFRVVTATYSALGADSRSISTLTWNGNGFFNQSTPTVTP